MSANIETDLEGYPAGEILIQVADCGDTGCCFFGPAQHIQTLCVANKYKARDAVNHYLITYCFKQTDFVLLSKKIDETTSGQFIRLSADSLEGVLNRVVARFE